MVHHTGFNRGLVAAALAFVMLATPGRAQDVVLDLTLPASAKAATIQVPASGGSIPLTLVKTGAKASTVRVAVTPFLSDAGERLAPLIAGANAAVGQTELTINVATQQLSNTSLVVPPLPGAGPYTGSLFVTVDDAAPVRQVIAIAAASPSRPAVLQITPETAIAHQTIRLPFWRSRYSPPDVFKPGEGPALDIRLADTAGKWPLNGVTVGPAAVTKAPGDFSLSAHAAFYDEHDRRLIPPFPVPTEGRTIRLQLGGLTAGEYNATIPFLAANAGTDPRKLAVVVFVKHHVSYAVLCLLVALLLSYLASKLVSMRNERVTLIEKIDKLRPFWLQSEPQTMTVVWIQSIVKQASQLSQRRLLPSLDTIHTRLDTAAALLQPLDRLRRVRDEIKQSSLPRFAKARALKLAERLGDRLDPELQPADIAEIMNAIAQLRAWTRQDEAEACYSADLQRSINQLLADVDAEAISEAHRPHVTAIVDVLKTALPKATADLEERERQYAALKILWERRSAAEFVELLSLRDSGIDRLFQKADDTAWARLKAHQGRVRLESLSHRNGVQPEAYDPLTFRLTAGDTALDATFLFMHGLKYEWTFEMQGKSGHVSTMRPVTRGPQVPLFAPFAGKLKPSLKFVHQGEPLHVQLDPIAIARSSRFTAFNSFSAGEVIQLGLAFVVAVITGLQTFYNKADGFGSLADYMALFAWGTTVDQVKNFLQRLPSSSASVPVAATVAQAPAASALQAAAAPAVNAGAAAAAQAPAQPGVPAPGAAQAPAAPAPAAPPPAIQDPLRPSSLNLGALKQP